MHFALKVNWYVYVCSPGNFKKLTLVWKEYEHEWKKKKTIQSDSSLENVQNFFIIFVLQSMTQLIYMDSVTAHITLHYLDNIFAMTWEMRTTHIQPLQKTEQWNF